MGAKKANWRLEESQNIGHQEERLLARSRILDTEKEEDDGRIYFRRMAEYCQEDGSIVYKRIPEHRRLQIIWRLKQNILQEVSETLTKIGRILNQKVVKYGREGWHTIGQKDGRIL